MLRKGLHYSLGMGLTEDSAWAGGPVLIALVVGSLVFLDSCTPTGPVQTPVEEVEGMDYWTFSLIEVPCESRCQCRR